jgi:uncharacterized protein
MMKRGRLLLVCIFAVLLLFVPGTVFAFDVPSHDGWVTDTAGVLTTEDDTILEARIAGYRSRTGNEIGVLVIPSLDGETIEDVAYKTFNVWGVGKKGLDNGVLLVIAMNEHRSRIETGKGVGDLLTDVTAAKILSNVLAPYMRRGETREGILATIIAIEGQLDGRATTPTTTSAPASPVTARPDTSWSFGEYVFLGCIFGFVGLMVWLARRSRGGRAYHYDGSSYGSHDYASSSSFSSGSSFDSGGSSFSSGGGGGGGDFGGGSSGGGGASGSW